MKPHVQDSVHVSASQKKNTANLPTKKASMAVTAAAMAALSAQPAEAEIIDSTQTTIAPLIVNDAIGMQSSIQHTAGDHSVGAAVAGTHDAKQLTISASGKRHNTTIEWYVRGAQVNPEAFGYNNSQDAINWVEVGGSIYHQINTKWAVSFGASHLKTDDAHISSKHTDDLVTELLQNGDKLHTRTITDTSTDYRGETMNSANAKIHYNLSDSTRVHAGVEVQDYKDTTDTLGVIGVDYAKGKNKFSAEVTKGNNYDAESARYTRQTGKNGEIFVQAHSSKYQDQDRNTGAMIGYKHNFDIANTPYTLTNIVEPNPDTLVSARLNENMDLAKTLSKYQKVGDVRTVVSKNVTTTIEKRPNTAPVAKNDSAVTPYNTPVIINVLSNDTDVDGDTIIIADVTGDANGTWEIVNWLVRFTPKNGFVGTANAQYTIIDNQSNTPITASISVEVQAEVPVNSPAEYSEISGDSTLTIGQTAIYTITASDKEGVEVTATVNGRDVPVNKSWNTYSVAFTPTSVWNGTIQFTIIGKDSLGNITETKTVIKNITVNAADTIENISPVIAVADGTTITVTNPGISDQDGIKDIVYTIKNISTNTTVTNGTGVFDNLDNGTYSVTVAANVFNKETNQWKSVSTSTAAPVTIEAKQEQAPVFSVTPVITNNNSDDPTLQLDITNTGGNAEIVSVDLQVYIQTDLWVVRYIVPIRSNFSNTYSTRDLWINSMNYATKILYIESSITYKLPDGTLKTQTLPRVNY